jgi:flagellar hook-basal body complex protein FliE
MIGSILAPGAVGRVGAPVAPGAAGGAATAGGPSFSSVLAGVAAGAVDNLKAGETAAISGINGGMPVQRVVESVMSAEQALQTAIAVRDKLVSAYQDVTRMAI